MKSFWIADNSERVLGPITLPVMRDLLFAGRIGQVAKVSLDGRSWAPVERFPEVLEVISSKKPEIPAMEQVARVRQYFASLQSKPAHEIFRVPEAATLEEYRAAFFALVKRFYPDRLPPTAHLELRAAFEDLFLFLAGQMVQVEQQVRQRASVEGIDIEPELSPEPIITLSSPAASALIPPPPPPAALAASAATLPGQAVPTYRPEEFIGLERRSDGRLEAHIQVNLHTVGMFTDHPVVNLSALGMFIPMKNIVPLGTYLDVCLKFDGENSPSIQSAAKVIWENLGGDKKHPLGFGVRFLSLGNENKTYLQNFISKVAATQKGVDDAPQSRR
jgi:hypothetical protein